MYTARCINPSSTLTANRNYNVEPYYRRWSGEFVPVEPRV